jgi:membrane protease subunit HflK
MFLEVMEEIYEKADKVILDTKGNGVVPYLPLPELQNRAARGAQPQPQGTNQQ